MLNPLGFLKPGMEINSLSGGLLTMDKYHSEEDTTLLSEEEWLKFYPNPVTLNIKVPEMGGDPSWGFHGQIIQVVVDPRMTIMKLKDNLSDYLGKMPPKKMKLRTYNQSTLKDGKSLAFYNVIDPTLFELGIKERGGRK